MTIRLITFHTPKNYGAVLQAYALQTCLSRYGETRVADYHPAYLDTLYRILPPSPLRAKWLAHAAGAYRAWTKRHKKFARFTSRFLALDERYGTNAALEKANLRCDALVTGSDQVFNPTSKPRDISRVFYLDFAADARRRVAYAPSFGVTSIPENMKEEIAARLARFDALSAREDEGARIIRELTGREAEVVLDPVLLLPEREWALIEADAGIREPFLFCYALDMTPAQLREAERLAKEKSLRLVAVQGMPYTWIKRKFARVDTGPEEFVWLMRHASYVLTDSFHGTAFSVLFHKPFAVYGTHGERDCRVTSLLERLGLSERFLARDKAVPKGEIDFARVDERLAALRARSLAYLERALDAAPPAKPKIGDAARCNGCGACEAACAHGAIGMREDEDGFPFPVVSEAKCVRCGACERVCPMLAGKSRPECRAVYSGFAKDEAMRASGASGGVYGALAKRFAQAGGLCYGAVLSCESGNVEHLSSEDAPLSAQQKSKYVQSSIRRALVEIPEALKAGRRVLFCAAPCQADALRNVAGDDERLITIDILCHGVPSPKLFRDELERLGRERGSAVTEYEFRNKRLGWSRMRARVKYACGDQALIGPESDAYFTLFNQNATLRRACYVCPYAAGQHGADLTISDFWLKRSMPGGIRPEDERGLSMVTVNTRRGEAFLAECSDVLSLAPVDPDFAARVYRDRASNPNYHVAKRERFYKIYRENGAEAAYAAFAPKLSAKKRLKKRLLEARNRMDARRL